MTKCGARRTMDTLRQGIFTSTIIIITIIDMTRSALTENCKGEGLVANHTSGCRDYYRCKGGTINGRYSCPPGLAFNAAARQCLQKGRAPCIQHQCDPNDTIFYAAPGTQCRYYYKCEKGTELELTCPGGSWFDFKKQECTRSAGVCYEPVCTGLTDGRYPDSTQGCQRSLICSGGDLIAVQSSDPISGKNCPSPRATAVAFPIAGSDRCASLPDGPYPAPGARCKDYIICRDGETQASMRCPDSFRFDGQKCSPEESTPCVDECTNLDDGFHVDLTSGCREYFYCQNHSSLLRTACSEGTLFDGQMCVSSAFYNCPIMIKENPCVNRPDGYHRDFKDCRSYIYCSSEEVQHRESCPLNQVWNGVKCVSPNEFHCEGPVQWPGCTEKPSGFHQNRTRGSDCKNYYYCSKDTRIHFSCPPQQLFNGEECVHESIYTCPSLEKDSCDFKEDGYYQQTNGECRAYYMCSGGNKIIYLCDINQVFNGEKCVDKNSYKCPYHTEDCIGKSNGYHQDINTNCRKYYFCDNDEKLTTLQCSGSKIFNGRGCVSPKDYQCPMSKNGNVCSYKMDGFYVKEGTKCRQYYKCINSVMISDHMCPTNKIFNGINNCIEKNCSVQTITCERNGFYLDLPSRCTSYHICIDKRKSTLQCEIDKVFNGQTCVPRDTFTCPDECSQQHCHHLT